MQMTAQQPWLISYEYTAIEAIPNLSGPGLRGENRVALVRGNPVRTVELSDLPPWKLLAEQKAKIRAAEKGDVPATSGLHRVGDDIHAIFWAVQLPIGGLTEEEMELLS